MRSTGSGALITPLLLLLLISVVLPPRSWAQQSDPTSSAPAQVVIDWHVIATGGEMGTSDGVRMLSGTVGQAVIGVVSNSTGILSQGFWYPHSELSSVSTGGENTLPQSRMMLRNYPNPFPSSTTIAYQLSTRSNVRVRVIDPLGTSVRSLSETVEESGDRQVQWDGLDDRSRPAPSGFYFYEVTVEPVGATDGAFTERQRMLLVR